MATEREDPYPTFRFLVDIGTGDTDSVRAGFQEVTGLSIEMTSADYRNGNDPVNRVRKMNGLYSIGDVTMRRGVIGALDLYEWVNQVRVGDLSARRSVVVTLRNEAGEEVLTWRLTNARPLRYNGPALNGKTSTDVAIEELQLSCEDLVAE